MKRDEIREAYDRFARWYDWTEGLVERFLVRRHRRRLLARAEGRVLEMAVGTGASFRHYATEPPSADVRRLVAVDLSRGMLERARRKASRYEVPAVLAQMDGERLAFPDASFDTVVDGLTLCTYPNPLAALREMARVCRHDGRILLLEHGRSDRGWLGRWMDRRAEAHARQLGCHWNREPLELVRAAGLEVVEARRRLVGILHSIEARPPTAYISWKQRSESERTHDSAHTSTGRR